jgi:prepilin-type N-terminal cleavage/methylation domain-containing protein
MKRQTEFQNWNRAGFSLLEIMVTMAVMSIIGVVVFGFASSASTTFSKMKTSTEIADSMEELRSMMAVNKQCTENFKGLSANAKLPITQIDMFDVKASPAVKTSAIIKKGLSSTGQVEVMSMEMQPLVPINNELKLSSLEVTFKKVASGETFVRTLPTVVLLDSSSGKIRECWLRQDATSVQRTQACIAASQGAVNTYDPVTNTCLLTNGKWYKGATNAMATCPPGWGLPRFVNSQYHCEAKPPPGFDDKVYGSYVAVPLTTGSSSPVGRAPTKTAIIANGCSCALGTDIPAGVRAGFSCNVYCIGP